MRLFRFAVPLFRRIYVWTRGDERNEDKPQRADTRLPKKNSTRQLHIHGNVTIFSISPSPHLSLSLAMPST